MKSAYIITDKTETELSLVGILPATLLEDIQIIASSTRSGAIALARSLMLEKHRPVALVVDPETSEPSAIQEKHDLISTLLWPTSAETTYRIFLSPKTQSLTDRNNPIVHDLIKFLSVYIKKSSKELTALMAVSSFVDGRSQYFLSAPFKQLIELAAASRIFGSGSLRNSVRVGRVALASSLSTPSTDIAFKRTSELGSLRSRIMFGRALTVLNVNGCSLSTVNASRQIRESKLLSSEIKYGTEPAQLLDKFIAAIRLSSPSLILPISLPIDA